MLDDSEIVAAVFTATPVECRVHRLDVVGHSVLDEQMRELQRKRIADEIGDTLIFVEHPEVVTAGRRTKRDLAIPPPGYSVFEVDRGGGLTWHGPGQLVVYPIFKWTLPGERSVRGVIEKLETWIIASLASLGIESGHDPRMHGVWVSGCKIASIGLSFQHWVTRHGLSINLSTPPGRVEGFAGCALTAGTTTSLHAITGRMIERREIETALLENLQSCLQRRAIDANDANP